MVHRIAFSGFLRCNKIRIVLKPCAVDFSVSHDSSRFLQPRQLLNVT
jgi:hypothetical protein